MTTTDPFGNHLHLEGLIAHASEDLSVEYKDWLDLNTDEGKANLAKAAIAIANHGGGYVVLGFRDRIIPLRSTPLPIGVSSVTQDSVNEAIRRYASPEFQSHVYMVQHPDTSIYHPVVRIPASDIPVLCKRDNQTAGVGQYKIYVRKPGPRSEEPHTVEEWRTLLDRCVRARREDMLDAIRGIVSGVETRESEQDLLGSVDTYCEDAFGRWQRVTEQEPADSHLRFQYGFYEMGFALIGATPTESLQVLKEHLKLAQSTSLHGWPIFLDKTGTNGWEPHVSEGLIQAWIGPRSGDPAKPGPGDFWSVSPRGELYTIVGYSEDSDRWGPQRYEPGKVLYGDIPIIKLAEGLLFVNRFAKHFEGVQQIGVRCRFTGLKNRGLIWVDSWEYHFRDRGPVCYDPEVYLTGQVWLNQIEDNLPEAVQGMLKPLYERFDFFDLSVDRTQSAIQNLRGFRKRIAGETP